MSVARPVAPEDFGLAGRGDVSALRRLRDHWLNLASGEAVNPFIPKAEALPQVELLAELAAGTGEPGDLLTLVVAYHIRIESLERDVEGCEALAKEAVAAGNVAMVDRWTDSVVEFGERLAIYRAKVDSLLEEIFNSADAAGTAMIVSALTLEADRGDERAATMLQIVMDAMSAERAAAIQSECRRLEKELSQ